MLAGALLADRVGLIERGVLHGDTATSGAKGSLDTLMEPLRVLLEALGQERGELLGCAHVGAEVRAKAPFVGRVRVVESVGH